MSEASRFQQLQARLPALWKSIEAGADVHTSVVVPSLSFPRAELAKITGAPFYEERLLFTLIRLVDPRARVLYVTSQPIHPRIVDYYLDLLPGVPSAHARARLEVLCAYDGSDAPLTRKILDRPRLVERMRHWIGDPARAYLTCFNATSLERDLALELDIPLNGVDPEHLWMGTKSGSRKIFAEAGIACARGCEDLRSENDVLGALMGLAAEPDPPRRAMIKLDDSFAGSGNAVFEYPQPLPHERAARRAALRAAFETIRWSAAEESWPSFSRKIGEGGGVVEELIEAPEVRSPSVQMRINPLGEASLISTHDQVLGGATGQSYVGCTFPADLAYRDLIQEAAGRIGAELARRGVISRFGIDFLLTRHPGTDWQLHAIEINLRMGGTTPPFLALQFLTGGAVDAKSGDFFCRHGTRKCYYATDSLSSPAYRGLLPEDLMHILDQHRLEYSATSETGVLFHMIGALSQHGKVGVTCIGDSPEEAEELFGRTVRILDLETAPEAAVAEPRAAAEEPVSPME